MANARLEELKARFDENPRRYFAPFANELRKTGDFAQAIAICRTHLASQPGHVSGHIVLAQALQEAGELDESRTAFEAALELDPENLIALRHMGDIARARGDLESARGWYQRVLDADPRNDDMARVLRELPAEPNESVAAAAPDTPAPEGVAATEAAAPSAPPTPRPPELSYGPPDPAMFAPPATSAPPAPTAAASVLTEEVVPPAVEAVATPEAPVVPPGEEDQAPTAESPRTPEPAASDLDGSLDTWFLPGTTRQLDAAAPGDEGRAAAPSSAPTDWTDESFELTEELPARTESSLPRPTPAADLSDYEAAPDLWLDDITPEPTAEASSAPEAAPSEVSTDFHDIESWFDSRPAVPQSSEPSASELATSEFAASALGSGEQAAVTEQVPEEPEELSLTPAAAAPGVEASPSDAWAAASETPQDEASTPSLGTSGASTFSDVVGADPVMGRTPEFDTPATESQAAPFVTETLAELYLQQGFREEALSIYRQLVERDPSDHELRRRLEAVEHGEASGVMPGLAMPAPGAPDRSSVSVRTFFGRLARRSVGQPREGHDEGGGQGRTSDALPTRPHTGAFSTVTVRESSDFTSGQHRGAEVESTGTLATLFGPTAPSESDSRAADTLASAFGDASSQGAPGGRPARLAERELSLDHLFSEGAAGGSADSTSLDEFYRPPEPHGGAESTDSGARAPEERTADLRQFTAWLEGLKKK